MIDVLSPEPAGTAAGLSSRRRTLVLAAMCLALVMVVSGVSMLNNALPLMAESLGLSQSRQQWVIDGYTVALAALLLPAGAVGDRFGRRRAMLGGIVVFGVGSLLAATTDSAQVLIAARIVAGLGAAFIMPGTLSTITSVFPPEGRAKAVGIWAGFAGAGGTLGMFVSGALVDRFDWSSVFLVSAALAVVTLLAVVAVVPDTKASEVVRLDPVGAVLSAVGIAALVIGIIEGPTNGWTSGTTVGLLLAGTAFLAAFVRWERRNPEPMLDPDLFTHRGLATGSATMFLMFLAMFGFFFVSVQYLQLVQGYGALKAAAALFPMSAVFLVISPFAATLSERHGQRAVGGAGLSIAAVGFALFLGLEAGSGYLVFLAISLVVGLGMALSMTPATNAIVSSLPRDKQGVASAINDVTRELGAAFGIAMVGSAFNMGYRGSIDSHLDGLPAEAAQRAHEAPATAYEVASTLGDGGGSLIGHTDAAFVSGLHNAVLVGAACMVIGALFVALRAPSRSEEILEDELDASDGPDVVDPAPSLTTAG
jgi:EmrB/QacA subfamily drug resistance transporter